LAREPGTSEAVRSRLPKAVLRFIDTMAYLGGVAWIFASDSHQSALLLLLLTYVPFFALSQVAVIWVYISEVFPTSVRSKGQGVGSASHWIANTIISLTFLILAHDFGQGTPFALFAAATVLQLIIVGFFYPETKGKTLGNCNVNL